ncbi:MAG: hypothetical protein JNK50_05985 [Bacteroidia bacterium]|nr:hypothetical protein [Bacteroidia bacterium]
MANKAKEIIEECEKKYKTHKAFCNEFVIEVAKKFGVTLSGDADEIVKGLKKDGWTLIKDGKTAKEKADNGWFVVAGLRSDKHDPPRKSGHVAIVVKGELAHDKYPTGWWGSEDNVKGDGLTLNYSWNKKDRDNIVYAGKEI